MADATEMAPPDVTVVAQLGDNVVLGHYPRRTKVIATISGSSTIKDGVNSFTYDLAGHPGGAGGDISLNSDLPGLSPGNQLGLFEMTDTIDVQGTVFLGQRAQQIFVGADGRPWAMTGHATGSVRRVEATLGIGVQFRFPHTMPEIASSPGQSLTLLPRSVEGTTLAAADPGSWLFTPDAGGRPTPACTRVTRTLCEVSPMESGTVTTTGYANSGPPVSASLHITIPTPTIALTLSADSVAAGDTVFVTAQITEARTFKIEGYAYDAPGATGTCLTASAPAPSNCYIVPTKSGTLTVRATLDGKLTTSKGQAIRVTECALFADPARTDPLFQDPKVQALMRGLADATGWDKPLAQQAERGAYLVSKNGEVSMKHWPPRPELPPNPCSVITGSLFRNDLIGQGYTILAQIHTHPNAAEAELDPGNCYYFDGTLRRIAPEDGTLELKPQPSDADLTAWMSPNTPPAYPGYVLGPKTLYRWENIGAGLKESNVPVSSCVGGQLSRKIP